MICHCSDLALKVIYQSAQAIDQDLEVWNARWSPPHHPILPGGRGNKLKGLVIHQLEKSHACTNSYRVEQPQGSKQAGGYVLVPFRDNNSASLCVSYENPCVKYLDTLFIEVLGEQGFYDAHVGQIIKISRMSHFISGQFSALRIFMLTRQLVGTGWFMDSYDRGI